MGTLRTILGVGVVLAISSQLMAGLSGLMLGKTPPPAPTPSTPVVITPPSPSPSYNLRTAQLAKLPLTEQERARVVKAATKSLSKNRDNMEKVTFYGPVGFSSTRTEIGAYIGLEDGGAPYVRVKAAYAGDNWVFFEKIKIMVDDEVIYEKTFPRNAIRRDNAAGRVWEIADFDAKINELIVLEKISRAKTAMIRYSGRERLHDHQISSREKAGVAATLKAYKELDQNL